MMTTDFSGAAWRKSARSQGNGGQCVEVAQALHVIGLRDSKDPDGGVLAVSRTTFTDFLTAVKANQLH